MAGGSLEGGRLGRKKEGNWFLMPSTTMVSWREEKSREIFK